MIGTWIDGLESEQKDRIIEGRAWTEGDVDAPDGSRCLVGHAFDGWYDSPMSTPDEWNKDLEVAIRFDVLVRRFGVSRIVRTCKVRAGTPAVVLPQPVAAAR